MKKYLVLYNINHDPIYITADCVNIDADYTEFILNHQVIARYFRCLRWELLNEN